MKKLFVVKDDDATNSSDTAKEAEGVDDKYMDMEQLDPNNNGGKMMKKNTIAPTEMRTRISLPYQLCE